MRYTTIIKYIREGDKVTPVRYSQFHGQAFARVLDMSFLFKGHTSWINDDVLEREAVRAHYSQARKWAA